MTAGDIRRGGKRPQVGSALSQVVLKKRKNGAQPSGSPARPPAQTDDAEGDDFAGDAFDAPAPAGQPSDDDDDAGLAPLPVLGEEEEGAGPQPLQPKKKREHPKKKKAASAWAAASAAVATLADAAAPTQAAFLWAAYGEAIGDDGGQDPELAGLRAAGGRGVLALPPAPTGAGGRGLGARLRSADPALAAAASASTSAPPPAIASPIVLALSASANHCLDVRRSGLPRAVKLFARHIKVSEQAALRSSPAGRATTTTAIGTPARVLALLDAGALSLDRLRLLILDVRRDAKQRTLLDLPETKGEVWALVRRGGVGGRVVGGQARVAVFDSGGGCDGGGAW